MENENTSENILETMPMGPLFIKMAVPAVLSQLINILYNLVDKMFIGHMKAGGSRSACRTRGNNTCYFVFIVICRTCQYGRCTENSYCTREK